VHFFEPSVILSRHAWWSSRKRHRFCILGFCCLYCIYVL